ncbi:Methyltransferase type 11 [Solidesulfovibrio carbinoliphilus subsp. oakridgensis]|uniref:Methyltransferase type 11 n=1 Tax=Solidesulfovibrio carbinoliphilus subsp. oakridgensis TaxID=694327 RepID=G7QCE5_9BACT|nr:methyltransferase domain-containing protein [Solidesulfovibrio carbinoliphilus]EHJ46101.1 Methyltransferase type 11 [Solidesulfovibrio carbinoliphilus subsp. oakridgensis]
MKRPLQRRFEQAAATYEAAAQVQRLVAARLAALCPATLGAPVLEIGAGSGLLTRALLPRTRGPYLALDLAPGMLARAAMPGARKVAADGERPPFRDGAFAFLASASAMHWYADPAASIPADLRLVRPGGGFAIALYVEGTLAELAEAAAATGFGSVYPMRPAAFYRELFAAIPGIEWSMEEARQVVTHESVPTLLRSLKGAGVTHTEGRRAGSPARYREFRKYYAERFGTVEGMPASYAVLYCCGRRTGGAG